MELKNARHGYFKDLDRHLTIDEKPSVFLEKMFKEGLFTSTYPFTLLGDLVAVEQAPEHHPEGNVWNHTLLVVDFAAETRHLSKAPRVLMWAALLHDLGKIPATRIRKGRITAYDHDKYGEILAIKFLTELTDEKQFIDNVSKMVRWHMQILFVVKKLPFADIQTMIKEIDINEIALLSWCDRLGRGSMTDEMIEVESENISHFLYKCQERINGQAPLK